MPSIYVGISIFLPSGLGRAGCPPVLLQSCAIYISTTSTMKTAIVATLVASA